MASIPDMLTSLRSKSSAIPPSRLPARISNGSGLQEEQTKQTRQAVSIGASEVATSYQDVYYLHLSDQTSATRIIPGGYLIVSLFYEPVIFVTFFSLFFFFPYSMASEPASTKSGGLSLYANLLDPSSQNSSTISRAPVVFKQSSEGDPQPDDAAAEKQQISAGSQIPSSMLHTT